MRTIQSIAIAVAIIVFAVLAYISGQEWLRNNAIDECNKLAVGIKAGDYVRPLFESCLKEKGYKIVTK